MKNKSKFLVFLPLLLWALSIPFRMYYVTDTTPVNNVAHIFMLQTIDIWKNEGPCVSNFAMKHTYENPGDKHITYYKRLVDKEGFNYYISHPPLSQSLVWFFSAGGRIHVNNLFLTWLALLTQLVTVYFLFFTLQLLLKNKPYANLASFFAIIVYTFHPVILYLTTFHFFAESLGQMFFMICLYYLTKVLTANKKPAVKTLLILFVSGFLFALSEWLSLFMVIAIFVLIVLCKKNRNTLLKPFLAMGTGVAVAVTLFAVQHIQLTDVQTFVKALGIRYVERSGFFGDTYTDMGYSYLNPQSYLLLLKQTAELFKGVGVLFFVIFLADIFRRKARVFSTEKKTIVNIMLLSCGFYFLALFSATVTHYIYIAKWVIPLTILSVPVLFELSQGFRNKTLKIFTIVIVSGSVVWSGFVFSKKASLLQKPDPVVVEMANYISKNVEKDVSVFCAPTEDQQITWVIWLSYASKRNIAIAKDEQSICYYMATEPEKYVYIIPDSKGFEIREGVCLRKGE